MGNELHKISPPTFVAGIDPGFEGTGLAIFKRSRLILQTTIRPSYEDLGRQWLSAASFIAFAALEASEEACLCENCRKRIEPEVTLDIFIEFPQVWAGSARSHTSSTRGHIPMLCGLAGILGYALGGSSLCRKVTYLTPNEWKGQLPKEVVQQRIASLEAERKITLGSAPSQKFSSHSLDAVGIALFGMGFTFGEEQKHRKEHNHGR